MPEATRGNASLDRTASDCLVLGECEARAMAGQIRRETAAGVKLCVGICVLLERLIVRARTSSRGDVEPLEDRMARALRALHALTLVHHIGCIYMVPHGQGAMNIPRIVLPRKLQPVRGRNGLDLAAIPIGYHSRDFRDIDDRTFARIHKAPVLESCLSLCCGEAPVDPAINDGQKLDWTPGASLWSRNIFARRASLDSVQAVSENWVPVHGIT